MIWGHSTVYIHIGQYALCYQFQPVRPIRKQALEPVCCEKHPKIVPDQLLVWGIMGPLKVLKVLNGTKLILDRAAAGFSNLGGLAVMWWA